MKVAFIDRDGVINEYPGDTKYVMGLHEFKLIKGSIEAIKKFKDNGFKVFVASNQAGVSKGLYTKDDLDAIDEFIIESLRKVGSAIDQINYCTHTTEDNCDCRKPKPGLLTKVLKNLEFEPECSFFIGDTFRDVKTAIAAGCKSVLVLSGKKKSQDQNEWEIKPDYVFKDLMAAADYLCEECK